MNEYLVVFERGPKSWGAYAPDLPGVGVAADSEEEVRSLIHEAIRLHIEQLQAQGEPVPPATTRAGYVKVA